MTPPAGEPRSRDAAGVAGARLRARVALMHEAAADGTGSAVQILVAAPHGEVRAAVMQRERQVTDGVSEIEAHETAGTVRGARDARQIECLAGTELHAGPEHQRELRPMRTHRGLDRRF